MRESQKHTVRCRLNQQVILGGHVCGSDAALKVLADSACKSAPIKQLPDAPGLLTANKQQSCVRNTGFIWARISVSCKPEDSNKLATKKTFLYPLNFTTKTEAWSRSTKNKGLLISTWSKKHHHYWSYSSPMCISLNASVSFSTITLRCLHTPWLEQNAQMVQTEDDNIPLSSSSSVGGAAVIRVCVIRKKQGKPRKNVHEAFTSPKTMNYHILYNYVFC